jgi:hypothetical protein
VVAHVRDDHPIPRALISRVADTEHRKPISASREEAVGELHLAQIESNAAICPRRPAAEQTGAGEDDDQRESGP